jgi:hypothetical protein
MVDFQSNMPYSGTDKTDKTLSSSWGIVLPFTFATIKLTPLTPIPDSDGFAVELKDPRDRYRHLPARIHDRYLAASGLDGHTCPRLRFRSFSSLSDFDHQRPAAVWTGSEEPPNPTANGGAGGSSASCCPDEVFYEPWHLLDLRPVPPGELKRVCTAHTRQIFRSVARDRDGP